VILHTHNGWDTFGKHTQNHDITIATITGKKTNIRNASCHLITLLPPPPSALQTRQLPEKKKGKQKPGKQKNGTKRKENRKLVSPQKRKEKTHCRVAPAV
jgi:hypothetical protein